MFEFQQSRNICYKSLIIKENEKSVSWFLKNKVNTLSLMLSDVCTCIPSVSKSFWNYIALISVVYCHQGGDVFM